MERSSQLLRKNLLAAKVAKVDKEMAAKISKKRQRCFFHPGK